MTVNQLFFALAALMVALSGFFKYYLDAKLDGVEKRLDTRIDALAALLNEKFKLVDEKFKTLDEKFTAQIKSLDEKFSTQITSLKLYIDAKFEALRFPVHKP